MKGEDINIVNCNEVIITGNLKTTEKAFERKRDMFGHSQKGPKHPATSEKIVKRAIRGMLPNHREGRGKIAFQRIKCYNKVPAEFEGKEMFKLDSPRKVKYSLVKEFTK